MAICVGLVAITIVLVTNGAEVFAFLPALGCALMMVMMVWMMVRPGGHKGGTHRPLSAGAIGAPRSALRHTSRTIRTGVSVETDARPKPKSTLALRDGDARVGDGRTCLEVAQRLVRVGGGLGQIGARLDDDPMHAD